MILLLVYTGVCLLFSDVYDDKRSEGTPSVEASVCQMHYFQRFQRQGQLGHFKTFKVGPSLGLSAFST